jgi:hypothetical protein
VVHYSGFWGLNSVEVAIHVQRAVAATIATTTSRFHFFEATFNRNKFQVFLLFLFFFVGKVFMHIYVY